MKTSDYIAVFVICLVACAIATAAVLSIAADKIKAQAEANPILKLLGA